MLHDQASRGGVSGCKRKMSRSLVMAGSSDIQSVEEVRGELRALQMSGNG